MRTCSIITLAAGIIAAAFAPHLFAAEPEGAAHAAGAGGGEAVEAARRDVQPMVPARILRADPARPDLPKSRVDLGAFADAATRQPGRNAPAGAEWLDWKDVRNASFRHDAVPDAVDAVGKTWDAFVLEVRKSGDAGLIAE